MMNMYQRKIKPIFDLLISLFLIIILSPLLVSISILLLIYFQGSPFFIQSRPGKNEKEIKVIKFKTMTDSRDQSGNLLSNNLRTTKLGHLLRNLSIDELPQLINIIKGEMSLVGPRPLLFKYIPLYSPEQRRRHLVKPGITGWAQVNGRNSINWTRKFELDVYYVENISFVLDMKILWLTLLRTLSSDGINAGKDITMPPFNGKN